MPREPLVARVGIGDRRVLVVDRGSPAGDECSLGILVPLRTDMTDRALAVAARKACRSLGGRWRSPMVRLIRPVDFQVIAINRGVEVWEDAGAYERMLGRRIASALGV